MLESDVFCGESIIEQLLVHAEMEGAGIVTATYEIMKEEGRSRENDLSADPSKDLEKKERSELIHTLINQLPEPQKSLVYFRHIEGKDYHEISELMDMNENAIRVSISRARKLLREMLQTQYSSWINCSCSWRFPSPYKNR